MIKASIIHIMHTFYSDFPALRHVLFPWFWQLSDNSLKPGGTFRQFGYTIFEKGHQLTNHELSNHHPPHPSYYLFIYLHPSLHLPYIYYIIYLYPLPSTHPPISLPYTFPYILNFPPQTIIFSYTFAPSSPQLFPSRLTAFRISHNPHFIPLFLAMHPS